MPDKTRKLSNTCSCQIRAMAKVRTSRHCIWSIGFGKARLVLSFSGTLVWQLLGTLCFFSCPWVFNPLMSGLTMSGLPHVSDDCLHWINSARSYLSRHSLLSNFKAACLALAILDAYRNNGCRISCLSFVSGSNGWYRKIACRYSKSDFDNPLWTMATFLVQHKMNAHDSAGAPTV